MQDLIKIAAAEIGITEIEGGLSNPRILEYARVAGFDGWYHNDDTPWCSVFLNWVTEIAGLERTRDGRASSWEKIGIEPRKPEPGDIALFVPVPGATHITHVGIFLGYSEDKTRIYLLGGNQSDQVNITAFSADTLVGFRRLKPVGTPAALENEEVLKRGDFGPKVKDLQDALKLAGFDVGTSDGDFGRLTEEGVKELQRSNPDLEVSGVFDAASRAHLATLLGNLS